MEMKQEKRKYARFICKVTNRNIEIDRKSKNAKENVMESRESRKKCV